jgi:hypothetical protein
VARMSGLMEGGNEVHYDVDATSMLLTSRVDDEARLALCANQFLVVCADAVNVHTEASVGCEGLLPQQTLRLPVELLDELAWQEARLDDLDPAPHAILCQAELQDVGLLFRPPGGGGEVPAARVLSGKGEGGLRVVTSSSSSVGDHPQLTGMLRRPAWAPASPWLPGRPLRCEVREDGRRREN